jgi:spore coat protein U-like protein
MKSLKIARIAAVALVAAASSAAFADSATLNVTANITGACKMSLSGPMAFGTLDPSNAVDVTTSATATYKCTKGQAAGTFAVGAITDGTAGYSSTIGNGTDTIAYAVNWTAPGAFTGAGFGAAAASQSVTLNGKILGTAYPNASAGNYTGNVAVSITP